MIQTTEWKTPYLKILYLTNRATLKLNIGFRFRMFVQEDTLPVLRGVVHCGRVYSGVTTSVPTHKVLSTFLLNNTELLKVRLICIVNIWLKYPLS